jgi:S-adenosylmethionine:tRNA ribosyltransferase-isomerase
MTVAAHGWFELPDGREADRPPEDRGIPRDGVRMLLVTPSVIEHRHARDLPEVLQPGDLVVVNTSATLPAAVGQTVHVSTELDDGAWVVEVRRTDQAGPAPVAAGDVLRLPGGLRLRLQRPHPDGQSRLWRAVPSPWVGTVDYLAEHGRPVQYRHLRRQVSLSALQNVYATEPGSAEMPSAGRPLSERVLVRMVARGIVVAPVVLHAGLSSPESHEPPQPERFRVPAATARLVNHTRRSGGRVVAVGTTVVRALESSTGDEGTVRSATGWTSLVLGPDRPARAVDGLLTGLHDPQASHLDLLEAVAGADLVRRGYQIATTGPEPYLWHEFGDIMLFLGPHR